MRSTVKCDEIGCGHKEPHSGQRSRQKIQQGMAVPGGITGMYFFHGGILLICDTGRIQ